MLATGPLDGFVEYVPESYTLTSILEPNKWGSIEAFFHDEHHTKNTSDRVKVLNTFVKSSAGLEIIEIYLNIIINTYFNTPTIDIELINQLLF